MFSTVGKDGKGKEGVKRIFYIMGVTGSGRHTLCECLRVELPGLARIYLITADKGSIIYTLDAQNRGILEDCSAENDDGKICYFRVIQDGTDGDNYVVFGDLNGYKTMKTVFCDRLIPIYIKADPKEVLKRIFTPDDDETRNIIQRCKQFILETKTYRQSNLEAARIKKGFYCEAGIYGFFALVHEVKSYMQRIISQDE